MQTALRKHGLRPDKGLGQHFLTDPVSVLRIVEAASPYAALLEIGPGPGVLTRPLAGLGVPLVALEIDARLAPVARDLAPAADVRLGDAMQEDLGAILRELPAPRAIVSNMPYYITHPLVERILAVRQEWDAAILMMQKEVAEKWLAKPGDRRRGSFSVFVQAIATVERVATVPAAAFLPAPQVDSVVLRFVPKREGEWPDGLDRFVRIGFSQPRKTLVNSLASYGKERISDFLRDPLARAHELTEAQWRELYVFAMDGTGSAATS